jgi:hypothetical protein
MLSWLGSTLDMFRDNNKDFEDGSCDIIKFSSKSEILAVVVKEQSSTVAQHAPHAGNESETD